MKKSIFLLLLSVLTFRLVAQTDYYWYKGEKIPLWKNTEQKYILLEDLQNITDLNKLINDPEFKILQHQETSLSKKIIPFQEKEIKKINWAVISNSFFQKNAFINNAQVKYESYFYRTAEGIDVGLSHLFYVKLIREEDLGILEQLAEENNVKIIGNNEYMPLWYTLSCSKDSKGDALDMANLFYESKQFEASVPDLISDDEPTCTNDPLFSDQWGLKNTGQYGGIIGIDINFCQAKEITTGNQNIIIAIVDNGLEKDHPDLTNIYPISYDAHTGTSPSIVRGPHGMPSAGIVGATNNNIGVAGIAPDCPLMDISISLEASPDARQKRADGINFAWENGATVISNSWRSTVEYPIINDAIENALEYGRNGLGCVVVFSAGNNNKSSVDYPANSHEDIIAVGGSDIYGMRANPCNYGTELDIVAPGMEIPTTDLQGTAGYNTSSGTDGDYYYFGATSAACPHVAAIAGLLLSVNPSLTQKDVNNIIESTTQKVGGYTYQNTTGRPNGTWHEQMGYGLVDAYCAVHNAQPLILTGPLSSGTHKRYFVNINNAIINTGATLNIQTYNLNITGTFSTNTGSVLNIQNQGSLACE